MLGMPIMLIGSHLEWFNAAKHHPFRALNLSIVLGACKLIASELQLALVPECDIRSALKASNEV